MFLDLYSELEWRGVFQDSTDPTALKHALNNETLSFYFGFDPTAPSLHIGNLVQIITAMRLQAHGHRPVALVGGATGMIGDPKGTGERKLNPAETVQTWTEAIRRQIERFFVFDGPSAARVINNYDWTRDVSALAFLLEVGPHFPVNRMLAREVVQSRLASGISFTEFSYVLLQSMDFLYLYRNEGIKLQFGGSDQWGNITGGVELIRRADGERAHAFVTPLVTRSDGTKYGKSEGGALWLDPEMLSPSDFHQFWLSVEDEKLGQLLRIFSFFSPEEINDIEAQTTRNPGSGVGQHLLADHMTALVHGRASAV